MAAVLTYPKADWIKQQLGTANLTPEMLKVIDQIGSGHQLLPNLGIQNPKPQQYIAGMVADLYAKAYAATNDKKQAEAIRNKLMDTLMGGIKNFDWRGYYFDNATAQGIKWNKHLNQVWGRLQAQPTDPFATLDRTQFQFGQTNSDISRAIIDGIATYVNQNASDTKKVDAQSKLDNLLDNWGLSSLKPQFDQAVWGQGLVNMNAALDTIRQTPEYKERFKGYLQHNATQPQKIASEGDYLKTEAAMLQIADSYLPAGTLDRKKAADLIAKGVSASEFDARVTQGYMAALNADPATRQALAAQGVDLKDLAHYFLDPKQGERALTQKVVRASLQGYATNIGLHGFTNEMAQSIADQARTASTGAGGANPYGVYTLGNARSGMEYAAQNQELTAAPVGTSQRAVSTEQLIGSKIPGFMGTTQAEAEQGIKIAAESKTAPFNKGGGYTSDQKGVTGIGSASQ